MNILTLMHKGNSKYSQSGQDAFVLSYFKHKRNGFFVDIGANDGVDLSNTYYLEKKLGWKGICFEPIPDIYNKLKANRSCECIKAGVAEKESVEKFTFVDGPSHMLSGMSKEYSPQHRERIQREVKTLGGSIKEVDVMCVVLNDVLEERGIDTIDYLSIDTEGNEFKILKSIDFDRFKIRVMTVENNYRDPEQTQYVVNQGYHLMGTLEADEVFIRRRR